MSSHVVVIDSTARRAVVKTNPSKPLADVLQEACTKLGLAASQYGLK
jgi:tether containing UBX domain for GLUT4